MSNLIDYLLDVTIGSSVTAVIILTIRLIFRKLITPKVKYYIWLILVVRLIFTVFPYGPLSIVSLADGLIEQSTIALETNIKNTPQSIDKPLSSDQYGIEPSVSYMVESLNYATIFIITWMVIAALLLLRVFYSYFGSIKELMSLPACSDREVVNQFERIKKRLSINRHIKLVYGSEPMLGGLLSPILSIPRDYSDEELDAVMTHELMHYRYADLWYGIVLRILNCIYWFNPFIWICFRLARLDCEMACDQRVLESNCVVGSKYASVLYNEAIMKNRYKFGTTSFSVGGKGLLKRIHFIAAHKKKSLFVSALVFAVVALTAALTLTNDNIIGKSDSITDNINGERVVYFESTRWSMAPQEVIGAQKLNEDDFNQVHNDSTDIPDELIENREVFGFPAKISYRFQDLENNGILHLTHVAIWYEKNADLGIVEKNVSTLYGNPSDKTNDKLIRWNGSNSTNHITLRKGQSVLTFEAGLYVSKLLSTDN